jgi:hypothetical protein
MAHRKTGPVSSTKPAGSSATPTTSKRSRRRRPRPSHITSGPAPQRDTTPVLIDFFASLCAETSSTERDQTPAPGTGTPKPPSMEAARHPHSLPSHPSLPARPQTPPPSPISSQGQALPPQYLRERLSGPLLSLPYRAPCFQKTPYTRHPSQIASGRSPLSPHSGTRGVQSTMSAQSTNLGRPSSNLGGHSLLLPQTLRNPHNSPPMPEQVNAPSLLQVNLLMNHHGFITNIGTAHVPPNSVLRHQAGQVAVVPHVTF